MASFTTVDGKTTVTETTMHEGGKKRLHLEGVGADRKSLAIESPANGSVIGVLIALFDGPKGIWTVDLTAKKVGSGDILVKKNGTVVAKLATKVVPELALPPKASEKGMLVRLFLAESRSPGESGYDSTKSKTGMQWMYLVLHNRLNNHPERFAARNAQNLTDIVKAKNPVQFQGFQNYPTIESEQHTRLVEIVSIANDDSDTRQSAYAKFIQDALDTASEQLIRDPSPNGLFGWRTANTDPPKGDLVEFSQPQSGNQFFTLK